MEDNFVQNKLAGKKPEIRGRKSIWLSPTTEIQVPTKYANRLQRLAYQWEQEEAQVRDGIITRPALRYYGGKWRLAPWILSHFPRHHHYVEPCGGAASVLLQKPPSELETYNDLNRYLVIFFQVLREHPDELIASLQLTPWSREEFERSLDIESIVDDALEIARRMYIGYWMSIGATPDGCHGVRFVKRNKNYFLRCISDDGENLLRIANRLAGVQLENRDALDCIQVYDSAETLIYFDPPYIQSTRTQKKQYRHETDDAFHEQAFAVLRACQGFVVVSGYQCELYQQTYESEGWTRIDKPSIANGGRARIESLWLSPHTMDALQEQNQQLTLFHY